MSILLFFIILAVLVLVHEFGHFIVAKKSGIRVDEFGLGFPPRLTSKKYGETEYSLNVIPFGGFVKIFGEDAHALEESVSEEDKKRSFSFKPKWIQALVLVAGISFNILFAWLLLSIGFMTGFPSSVEGVSRPVTDAKTIVAEVLPNSPAEKAGLKPLDSLVAIQSGGEIAPIDSVEKIQQFIQAHSAQKISITYARGDETKSVDVTPQSGVVEGKVAIGIAMDRVGILKLPVHLAIFEGAKLTYTIVKEVAVGLVQFIEQIFLFKADFSQVTGPIGIIGLVGEASHLGFVYLLTFTAFISINLAVINLIPFPALDGGRLLFVLIEAIKGSPIKPRIAHAFNTVGFALLLLLMVLVTAHDLVKLF